MYSKIIITLKVFILLLTATSCVQLQLIHAKTCIQYQIDSVLGKVLYSYHFNPHTDEVNMIIYNKQSQAIQQTGSGIEYRQFIQVQFNQTGIYPLCFQKTSNRVASVHFDIVDEDQQVKTAGKQDINKLSKKIADFLVDIRKTTWEFKQILQQHNAMDIRLQQNDTNNYWLYATKLLAMLILLCLQFYAVKYLYQ